MRASAVILGLSVSGAIACGPSAGMGGEVGSDGGSSGDDGAAIEALRQRWPGGYAKASPGGGSLEGMSLMEFDPDGRAYDYSLNCMDARSMPSPYGWQVVAPDRIEVVVTEETTSEGPVGDLRWEIRVADDECGPHRLVRAGSSSSGELLWPGRFCPENVVTGENFLKCEFVPCNDVALSCAEESRG